MCALRVVVTQHVDTQAVLLTFGQRVQRAAGANWLPSSLPNCRTSVLRKRLRLAVDKVIHHDDVVLTVIVRTWRLITTRDSHPRYSSVVKNDAEE